MPVAELMEWQSFFMLEPFGSHYDDLRMGNITAAIYNVNRDRKRLPEPFGPLDFTPWNDLSKKGQDEKPILMSDPEAQSNALMNLLNQVAQPTQGE